MKNKKIILLLILTIFLIGMLCGSAAASHTFKAGKYKGTISDSKYNSLKKKAKKGKAVEYTFKTDQYKTYKEPKYKTVKKKVWKYKTVVSSEDWWSSDWSDYTTDDYNTYTKYTNKGWTWYGSYYKTFNNGHHTKYYDKFKKKVTKKVKVKNGYKKVKKPVYMTVGNMDITGKAMGKKITVLDVWTDYGRLDI